MAYNDSLYSKKILITCGPTWVPIDGMRVISNASTGEIGHRISHLLCREGAKVTLVQGPVTHPLRHIPSRVLNFLFYSELSTLITQELKKTSYDIIIHAAAVSDYKLRTPYSKKISSNISHFKLELVPTPKIIDKIKKLNPKTFLVGFKLESETKKEFLISRALSLVKNAHCDLVVANVATGKNYKGFIISKDRKILSKQTSKERLAKDLVEQLRKNT